MPSSHLILCHLLLLLPPIPPNIRVFFNESTLHMRWPKYWSFSFSISPSNEYSGLIQVQCYKDQYCIGIWNVRSMNQGKLEVVKQETARVNIDTLGISELKWTGMGDLIQMTIISTTMGRESPIGNWKNVFMLSGGLWRVMFLRKSK